jgi:hypothetical protein
MKFKGVSPSMVVAVVALIAATAGTALAATGQLVNIADGSNAGNLAKVDNTGALRITGPVLSRDAPPFADFTAHASVSNFYRNGHNYLTVLGPTSAALSINRLVWTNSLLNANDWEVYLNYETTSSGSCSRFSAGEREIDHVNVRVHDSLTDTFPTPLLLKPTGGASQWCLMVGGGPTSATGSTSDDNNVTLGISGYVQAGTFTSTGVGAAEGTHSAQLGG